MRDLSTFKQFLPPVQVRSSSTKSAFAALEFFSDLMMGEGREANQIGLLKNKPGTLTFRANDLFLKSTKSALFNFLTIISIINENGGC